MAKYLLAFVLWAVLELQLLLTIGKQLGVLPTLGLVVASGLIGSWLAKRAGLRMLRKWQAEHAQGRVPEEGLVSAMLILVAGVLLIIPGFVSDAVGLCLLLPPVRRQISRRFRRGLERRMKDGTVRVTTYGVGTLRREDPAAQPRPTLSQGEVEAEFTEEGPKR